LANILHLNTVTPIAQLADQIEKVGLEIPVLADEYRYASLPLCVIDAVFSIGVRYTSTQRVVKSFCEHTGWPRYATSRDGRGEGTNGVTELVAIFDKFSCEYMAQSIFGNRQRTSSRSGILKSEAVHLYGQALAKAGIDCFTDFDQERREFAEAMILGLPGQSSGIAFDYFMMLAGDDNLVKPDRMVQRFVGHALSLPAVPQPRQAAILVRLAANELLRRGQQWTPLSLDHAIWKHQRSIMHT
jgi:hypothetical protein